MAGELPTLPVFIHSKLDDAGMTPAEFRVFCHIARRGECYAAVESIAKICRISKPTTRAALMTLTDQSFIIRETRNGQTTMHRIAPIEQWNPHPKTIPLQKEDRGQIEHTPTKVREATPTLKPNPYPYQNVVGKGNPFEGNPIKEGGTPGLDKRDGGLLAKDRERLEKQIQQEREKPSPDKEVIAGLKSELAVINAEFSRRGKTNPPTFTIVPPLAPAMLPSGQKPRVMNIHEEMTPEQRSQMGRSLREAVES